MMGQVASRGLGPRKCWPNRDTIATTFFVYKLGAPFPGTSYTVLGRTFRGTKVAVYDIPLKFPTLLCEFLRGVLKTCRIALEHMKLDLLAIAPHPDDVELTCGGTLLKMADAGYRTGILDLTQGETGTRGTPEIRAREATRAAKILGAKIRRNAGLPDARLRVCDEYKVTVAEIIRELQPRTVILPYWEGRHPDHYTAATLGYEACFIAGLKNYPLGGEPFRPFKIIYAAAYAMVTPTFAVDITKQYERRRRAILAYTSQFGPAKGARPPAVSGLAHANPESEKVFLPLDELEERMNFQARHYGRMIGVKFAEGFVVKDVMQVEDVVKMPVRSV